MGNYEGEGLWTIEEDAFIPEYNKHFEGVFTTGSGYMSVRGSLEEGLEDDRQDEEYMRMPANVTLEKARNGKSKWGTFIPGIMGPHPLLKEEIINLPWFLGIRIWFNGQKLDMEKSEISGYKRTLNLKDGTLCRSFTWTTSEGAKIEAGLKRFISLDTKSLSVQSFSLKILEGHGDLRIESGLNANVRTNGYNHFAGIKTGNTGRHIWMKVMTNGNQWVGEACLMKSHQIPSWKVEEGKHHIYFCANKPLTAGESVELLKLTSVATSMEQTEDEVNSSEAIEKDVTARCRTILDQNSGEDFDSLYARHASVWNSKWEQCDIKIDGDEFAQKAIRFSIFHLIRSHNEKNPRVAICAKGFSGEAYFGRFFWDTEIFLLPFFLYTNPEAARNLVLFRYNSLEGARRNAKDYGYAGARYAWESSTSGIEQCPNWQYADHEVHVTADVAYGLWHYYACTGDMKFMMQYGLEILLETSRYWVSRVNWDSSGCNLNGVMGPDEYTVFSRNNAFTNRMVKFNLEKTIELLEIIRKKDRLAYGQLVDRFAVTEAEIECFKKVKNTLVIPYDEERKLVLQSEDFEKFEDLDFQTVWTDRKKLFGQCVSQERMYRSKCLKQADVLCLMFLFPHEYTREQLKTAYEYYEPITTHDSSLSPSIHGVAAAWLGKMEAAAGFFRKSAGIDMEKSGCAAAEGIHIANCGGTWQVVLFGFAGIRNALQSDCLELNPALPSEWNGLEFSFLWKGVPVDIRIEKDRAILHNKGRETIKIKVCGKAGELEAGATLSVHYNIYR